MKKTPPFLKLNLFLITSIFFSWPFCTFATEAIYDLVLNKKAAIGDFRVAKDSSYQSNYQTISWVTTSDSEYCLDITDENWNIYPGFQALQCGAGLGSFSPINYVKNVMHTTLPEGFRFNWRVWSRNIQGVTQYGGSGYEGTVTVLGQSEPDQPTNHDIQYLECGKPVVQTLINNNSTSSVQLIPHPRVPDAYVVDKKMGWKGGYSSVFLELYPSGYGGKYLINVDWTLYRDQINLPNPVWSYENTVLAVEVEYYIKIIDKREVIFAKENGSYIYLNRDKQVFEGTYQPTGIVNAFPTVSEFDGVCINFGSSESNTWLAIE